MMRRYKELMAAYGPVAIGVYLTTFVVSMITFTIAIKAGVEGYGLDPGVAGEAGTLGAAWLATKAIQPLRIGATLLLTPFAARALGRHPDPEATASLEDAAEPAPREAEAAAQDREGAAKETPGS